MYSLLLMATMTTPTLAPDCHRHRCNGCFGGRGCHGSFYGGCHGGGCHGGGCYGGGGCWGGHGGCHGSAYNYGGSCWGGHGGYGCTGHAGCYGGGGYGGGSGYAPSYYGGAVMGAPATGGAVMPAPAPAPSVAPAPAPAPDRPRDQGYVNGPAHIYVNLPADARLFVDGIQTKTTDKANRTFLTPDLQNGIEYRYTMKAEVVRDGQTQSETKTVIVRAGEQVREEFGSLLSITTASR